MTGGEKFVKFVAICLAFTLICGILSVLFTGLSFLGIVFNDDRMYGVSTGKSINSDISKLNIYVGAADLEVKQGDYLYVESDNDSIKIKENNSVLTVTEVKRPFDINKTKKVTVYVPATMEFDSINIETGAGFVDISSLTSEKLNLELGAGVAKLSDITVSKNTDIDGGAGELLIENCDFTDLDLDLGVGECSASFILNGESDISSGVGDTEITLLSYSASDYCLKVDKGLGDVMIEDKYARDNDVFGKGSNIVNISCGVGSVDINFANK